MLSFGKSSKPHQATRKVQRWLSSGEAKDQNGAVIVLDVGWVSPNGGLLRVEEVECNIPGCAPIETLVTFLSEHFQAFSKVMKPIAEVVPSEVAEAVADLRRQFQWWKDAGCPEMNSLDEEKGEEFTVSDASQRGEFEKQREPLSMGPISPASFPEESEADLLAARSKRIPGDGNNSESAFDIAAVLTADEVVVSSSYETDRQQHQQRPSSEKTTARGQSASDLLRGVLGGAAGAAIGAAVAVHASNLISSRGLRRGLVAVALQASAGALLALAASSVTTAAAQRHRDEAEEEAGRGEGRGVAREAPALTRRKKMSQNFRPRGCPCCSKGISWPGKY